MKKERSKNVEEKDEEYLMSYVRQLEKRLRNFETEKQLLDAEIIRLNQELQSYKNEIDRLRQPPLVGAIVVCQLPDKEAKYVILTPLGQIFIVNASRNLTQKGLKPGTYVSINQRTFSIMEELPLTEEELLEAAKKLIVD